MKTETVYARVSAETRAALNGYCGRTGSTLANAVDELLGIALQVRKGPAEFYGPPVVGQTCALCLVWCFRNPCWRTKTVIHGQEIKDPSQLAEAAGRGLMLQGPSGETYDPRPIAVVNGTAVCALHVGDAYDMVFLKQRRF